MSLFRKLSLFVLGGVAGGILAYIYVKETRMAPLEEEIEDLNDYICELNAREDANFHNGSDENSSGEDFEDENILQEYRKHRKNKVKDDNVVVLADVQAYERASSSYSYSDSSDILKEITREEYEKGPDIDSGEEWNNVELSWYAYEQELRDSDDRLVPNTGAFLGDEDFEPHEKWYDASNEMIFLRNEWLKCDFKISLFEMREGNDEDE